MAQEKYLKFTYNGPQKINAYLRMPSPIFAVLYREIEMCLFTERMLPKCELKAYWIDEDGDDIEIVNQNDYEIFMSKRSERQHLQVAPRNAQKINNNNGFNNAGAPFYETDDPTNFIIHDGVECDACNIGPIIGFRYKCIECPNYDLCQRCEAQHKHPEHMVVRMPSPNSPSIIEAWVSSGGRCGRRASKRAGKSAATSCPFANLTPYVAGDAAGASGDGPQASEQATKENRHHHDRHERKHHRRQMRNGIFSHLYDMMQDLAEGGAANRSGENTTEGAGATASASATAKANVEAQVQNAVNEAVNASEIAAKAAAAAAKRAMEAAGNAEFTFPSTPSAPPVAEFLSNCEPMEDTQTFVKVNPVAATRVHTDAPMTTAPNAKTPPPTPDTTAPAAAPKVTKETNTNTEGGSIPVTPTFENLAQFVDPMYMKAGIQILNNFSEMFAKMLDPADGSDGGSLPLQMEFNEMRKNSTTSNTSKTSGNTTSANSKTTTVENNVDAKKEQEVASTSARAAAAGATTPVATAAAMTTTTGLTAPILQPTVVTPVESSRSRRRSQSDDSEWQLIDKQFENSSDSSADVSTASTLGSFDLGAAGEERNVDGITSIDINYEQLSKDLREHVQNEKKREEREQGNQNIVAAAAVETVTLDAATAVAPSGATAVAPADATAAPETTKPYDKEKRFHADDLINGAVHAMMAMGFSNEGAWLTQLLETVNGNISEALDLMSAAQRHNNNNK